MRGKGDPCCHMINRLRITIDTLAEIKREYNDVPVCMGECPYVYIYIYVCMYKETVCFNTVQRME